MIERIDEQAPGYEHGQIPGSLELAYLGDTVYDLYVRRRLVARGGRMKQLNAMAAAQVCAHAQACAFDRVEGALNEEEAAVARRARNAKLHPPRHADPAEYQRASALEALVGYLYIMGRAKRLDEIMRLALDGFF